jgi:phosphatidylethanolamine/phosphatidyl-N-methylethanolamine N-methyltransferase
MKSTTSSPNDSGRTYWERHAANYDRSMRILGGPLPRVLELIAQDVEGTDVVLEVAAGTGIVTLAGAPRVGRWIASDYAESMVKTLRERVARAGLRNVECTRRDLYALEMEDESVGAVVAANVLHLVPDLPGALGALRTVLRPGGSLLAPTYCHAEGAVARAISTLLGLTGFPGRRRFTADSLERALVEAGFRVDRVELVPGLIPMAYVAASRPAD